MVKSQKKVGFYHAINHPPVITMCFSVAGNVRLLVACWKDVHLPGLVAWEMNSGHSMEILWLRCLCYFTLIHYNLEIYLEIYLEIFGYVEICWDVLRCVGMGCRSTDFRTCSLPFSAISIEKWASSPACGITPGEIQHPKWIKMVDDKPSKCWDKIDPQNAGFLSITIVEMNHENGGFDQWCVEKFNTIKVLRILP